MGKKSSKGRYVCKIGFYDIYVKDTLKPAKESKNKWLIGEVISSEFIIYHSKKIVSKGLKSKSLAIENALELLGNKYKQVYSL
jgi:hypothetical protein